MTKLYDVHCVTPAEICGGYVYLGKAEFNEGLKCPRCGRQTKPGQIRPKDFTVRKPHPIRSSNTI